MYSINKVHKNGEIPHQCYFKTGDSEIRKNTEYSNFLHTYCDADYAIDIADRSSVTYTVKLFNGNLIDWGDRNQSETSGSSSNSETRAMYTGVLDQNWIRDFFISIGYPIEPPSKLYQETKQQLKYYWRIE